MAPSLEISIPSASTVTPSDAKQYTSYAISLRQPLRSYTVQKRYSDFVKLHSALTAQTSQEPPAPLPKKSWIRSTISSPELTETRRQALEAYLRAINDSPDPRWRQCDAWIHFLNLPSNTAGAKSGHQRTATGLGTRHLDLQAAGIDPSIWLDVHRDLKSQLNEARQALRRRDAAATAAAQHDAAAEVKRYLVRGGTLISTLDEALKTISDASKAEKPGATAKSAQLGEGEVRRRRDLLSAAKKEREALERQLSANVNKGASSGASTPAGTASPANEHGPFRPPMTATQSSSTNTTLGRRVLGGGGAAKETERTRALDNQGLLQLQQQIMQEQEEDVTDLTKTVQRMKEMGYQINDELQLQNEMLGLLGNDVDRVGDKLKIANKRIGKIS